MTIQNLAWRGFFSMALLLVSSAAQAQPTITSVGNAASLQPAFSPGSLAVVFGTNLTVTGSTTTVTVGSLPGFVLSPTTPTQINVQIPVNAPLGATTLTVTVGSASASTNITLAAYAPAFFEQSATVGAFADALKGTAITAANPATPGEILTGYAVGLGATNPAVATGVSPTGAPPTAAKVTLTLGTEAVTVSFAGLYSA